MKSNFINYNLLRFLLVFKVHSSLYYSFSVNIEVHLMGSPGNMCQLWRECVAITVSAIYLRFQYNLSIDQDIRHDAGCGMDDRKNSRAIHWTWNELWTNSNWFSTCQHIILREKENSPTTFLFRTLI